LIKSDGGFDILHALINEDFCAFRQKMWGVFYATERQRLCPRHTLLPESF